MRTIFINGKFTAQRTTGVQRVAAGLIGALDTVLSAETGGDWILLCPIGAKAPPLQRIAVRHVGVPGLPLHLWEQCVLPLASFGGLLLNLAGAAPYFARRQLCLVHDAAVFDEPQAYTRAFVGWYRTLFRHLARSKARLMTVSAFSRTRLASGLGLAPASIGIVPNGADHLNDLAADEGVLARYGLVGAPYLLSVASSNPTKNLARLIDAHASLGADLSMESCRLVVVGGRNDRVFARDAARDPRGVVRTGPIDDTELKALYLHAVALVFPSVYEGFGLPPLEAMACGCPVAASSAASIPEVCGDAALYFDPLSVAAIAAAMRQIRIDEPLRERLRSAGRARVRTARWVDAAALLLGAVQEESSLSGTIEKSA